MAESNAGSGNVKREVLAYGASNFVPRIVTFFLWPLFTFYLAPEEFGAIQIAETLAAFLLIPLGLGLPAAVRRLWVDYEGDPADRLKFQSTISRLAAGLFCVGAAVSFPVAYGVSASGAIERSSDLFPLVAAAALTGSVAVWVQVCLATLQLQGRPVQFAMTSVTLTAIGAFAALAGVSVLGLGPLGYLGGKTVGAFLAGLLALMWAWRALRGPFDPEIARRAIRFGVPLIPHQFLAIVVANADRLMIEYFGGLADVGVYGIGYTLGLVMAMVTSTVMLIWTPRYFRAARDGRTEFVAVGNRTAIHVMLIVAVIGIAISPWFIEAFMDDRYLGATRVVGWVIAGYFYHGVFSIEHLAVLHGERSRLIVMVTVVAATLNVALNSLWIPSYGIEGAAWATLACFFAEMVVVIWLARKVFPVGLGRITWFFVAIPLLTAFGVQRYGSYDVRMLISYLVIGFVIGSVLILDARKLRGL